MQLEELGWTLTALDLPAWTRMELAVLAPHLGIPKHQVSFRHEEEMPHLQVGGSEAATQQAECWGRPTKYL